ncbi:hypothetical protein [Geofilum rubicundum]|uniref:Peptidylprolyl isomerase n=1 Tax=Geofilum rubicundum JCM 15548 TaxID=1236989 RepID=A0A0E9LU81_9BACT|nr:hypothetical protein [Geofilum rubicundum]GAO28824.1 hypothetical protein JCM15548_1956 [Geofilum rubicundum JCM 15548]
MKILNKKYFYGWMAAIIMSLSVATGCDDPYANQVDYGKLEKEEADLRLAFFDLVKDSLLELSTDSVDKLDEEGWVSFEIEKGSSDSVMAGKRVAFKYTYYYVFRDDEGVPVLSPKNTNIGTGTLATYTVGSMGQQDSEVLPGVDLAIRHMCLYGKSYILMTHSLAFNDYYPVVAEIEVVAMDLD